VAPPERPTPPPPEVACEIGGLWEPTQPHELLLRAGGKPFAKFAKVEHAKLTLGAAAFVELRWKELTISGVVASDQLALHAAHPILIAGYIAPGANMSLHWAGGQRVKVVLPATVKPVAPVTASEPCDALAIESTAEFSPRDAVADKAVRQSMLVPDTAIPLATAPGEPQVAELRYASGDDPIVDVLEERGDHARIVVYPHSLNPEDNVALVGWVPKSALHRHDHGFGGSWGSGGEGGVPRGHISRGAKRVRCSHAVDLVGEQEGEQHPLGTVAPDVTIDVLSTDGDLLPITLRDAQLQLLPGSRLLAPAATLADCAPAT
jgi:hypothetical protein